MWHLTACKIPVSLVFELDQNRNNFLSYLWINVGNINSEIWWKIISFQERETKWNFIGCQAPHNTIYQFIKPFLDDKMSIFEEYGAFNILDSIQ